MCEKGGCEGMLKANCVVDMAVESPGEVRTGREERTRPNMVGGVARVVISGEDMFEM